MNVSVFADVTVSVIIPTYNSEKYVEKCLQSVIMQTLEKIEIIVVDNVSSDRTVELVEALLSNSTRAYKIINNPKLGVSYSRNIGLSVAKGEYIYFLDSDDYLTRNEALKTAYDLAKYENLDIVHFGFDRVNEDGKLIISYNRLYNYIESLTNGQAVLKEYLKSKIWFCVWNAIYKRETVQKNSITFVEDCFVGEDQEFVIKVLANSTNVLSIRTSFLNYVIRKDSLSKKAHEQFQAVDTFERVKKYLSMNNKGFEEIISIIDNHKIPYLIMRAIFKSVRSGISFEDIREIMNKNQRYIEYLKKARFGINLYYFSTYLTAKSFLILPRFSVAFMKILSRIIAFG